MAQQTEIIPSAIDVEGGRKINADIYNVRNFGYKEILEDMTLMSWALLEARSNNANASVSAQESVQLNLGFYDMLTSYNDAVSAKDNGVPNHELVFEVYFAKPREIQGMFSSNLGKLHWRLFRAFNVIIGQRDTEQLVWVGEQDEDAIKTELLRLIQVGRNLIGTGLPKATAAKYNGNDKILTGEQYITELRGLMSERADTAEKFGFVKTTQYDTGRLTATYPWLGRVIPHKDSVVVIRQESSKDTAPGTVPDAPDTDAAAA